MRYGSVRKEGREVLTSLGELMFYSSEAGDSQLVCTPLADPQSRSPLVFPVF